MKVGLGRMPCWWLTSHADRLINVIAHEYCHLANFMISGVKNCPHGREFREW